jgi:DNA polymerase-3 subunit beta
MIKTDPKTTVIIDSKNFAESVERASILTDDKSKSSVRLSFKKEEVNIENKDNFGILQMSSVASIGKTFDECDIGIYGEDLDIGFNHRYLIDALKAAREEKIMLKLESPTKSLVILPYDAENTDSIAGMDVDNSKFLYLVLPIRMKE